MKKQSIGKLWKRNIRFVTPAMLAAVLGTAVFMTGCGGAQSPEKPAETSAAKTQGTEAADDTKEETSGQTKESSSAAKEPGEETEAETKAEETVNQRQSSAGASEKEEEKPAEEALQTEDIALTSDLRSFGQSLTADKVYAAMSEWQFEFTSGAGAWQTFLTVSPDGSFTGEYTDSNMGETGEGYEENGTTYVSQFTGKFTDAKEVKPYIYELSVGGLKTQNESGTELIADGMRIVFTDPYGLQGTDRLYVYLPGASMKDLPESYINWIAPLHFGFYVGDSYYRDYPEDLPFCGIYNEKEDCGFFSADRSGRNLRFLVNRATWHDLISQKAELHEDGTYRYEDMDANGMHQVINLCYKAEDTGNTEIPQMNLYPKSFVLRCLEELGASPENEDTLYYFTMDDAEWYAPILYMNGKEGIYAFWNTGSNEDSRSWSARMTQIGDYVYVYAIGLSQYEELLAGEAAHFFQTSLTFSGRPELLSSSPWQRAEEAAKAAGSTVMEEGEPLYGAPPVLHTVFARVEPESENSVKIHELVFVGSADQELIDEYGLSPEDMTDDYAIVEKEGEEERVLNIMENCPVYIQFPEEGTFRSMITAAELGAYRDRFKDADLNMTLFLDEDDRIVYMYQNYTP